MANGKKMIRTARGGVLILEDDREVQTRRKFGTKYYHIHAKATSSGKQVVFNKSEAEKIAEDLKTKGWNVRKEDYNGEGYLLYINM